MGGCVWVGEWVGGWGGEGGWVCGLCVLLVWDLCMLGLRVRHIAKPWRASGSKRRTIYHTEAFGGCLGAS